MIDASSQEPPASVPLLEPRDGVPAVVADPERLAETVDAFARGAGPVAVDAERASGYRYGQRAYLVQLRRSGAGTAVIDPIACSDLTVLGDVLAGTEWVFHAASQDLPCLADVGLRPQQLFDTELAGRLLGYPRVGLGPLVQAVLGYGLEKGHSAVDWSTRPLPGSWLTYAALDVEVLIELRDALEAELRAQGKLGWAQEEFAAAAAAPHPPPRPDPWRRTSGVHRVRRPRQLAVVRALWEARDKLARDLDLSPGRVLPDPAIIEMALSMPATQRSLVALHALAGRQARRYARQWFAAVEVARQLPEPELPEISGSNNGPPPARGWGERDPAAAARLAACRAVVAALGEEYGVPAENVLLPDTVRRLAWTPPEDPSADSVAKELRGYGARPWQIDLTAEALASALRTPCHGGTSCP